MKNSIVSALVISLFVLFIATSCKKLKDVTPEEISEKLVGKYTMSEIIVGGQTLKLPYKQAGDEINGAVEVVKNTATQIEISFTINTVFKGVKEVDNASDNFYVKQGMKDIEIFEDEKFTKQIGSLVDGKTLFIIPDGTDRITAVKN